MIMRLFSYVASIAFAIIDCVKKQPTLFTQKVREIAKSIPVGKVVTYGMLAKAAGGGGQAARSVSAVLAKDPEHKKIPFHRIVYSDGRVWCNESCGVGRVKKLKKEGIAIDNKGKIMNLRDYLLFD